MHLCRTFVPKCRMGMFFVVKLEIETKPISKIFPIVIPQEVDVLVFHSPP